MTKDQKTVAVGAASGGVAMIASLLALYNLWPGRSDLGDVAGRLAYALQADAFAVLPLLIAIMAVGNNRFLSEAIDPTLGKESLATRVNGRVVDNTLQQYAVFLIATLALGVNLTSDQMRIIPAAVIVFVTARIAFWVGYRIHPLHRAFGMAATGYLNLGLLGGALWKAAIG